MASRLRRESSAPISFFAFLDIITAVTGILILVTLILATDIGGYAPMQAGDSQGDEALNTLLRSQARVEAENARMRRIVATAASAPAVMELTEEAAALRVDVAKLESRTAATAARTLARLAEQKQEASAIGVDSLREKLAAQRAALAQTTLNNDQLRTLILGLNPLLQSASNQLAKAQSLHGQSWLRPDDGRNGKQPRVVVVSDQGAVFTPLDSQQSPQSWPARSAEKEFTAFCRGCDSSSQYIVFLIRPSGVRLFNELIEIARKRELDVGYVAVAEDLIIHVGALPVDVSPGGGGTNQSGPDAIPQVAPPPADNSPPTISGAPTTPPTPPAPTAPPSNPSPPPKPKSWWERLIEFVKEALGVTPS